MNSKDYIKQALVTLSDKYYGERVSFRNFDIHLQDSIGELQCLDIIKKQLFYGKNLELFEPTANCADLPTLLHPERGTDILHGIIGVATESGELLELLLATINGKPFDAVNLKEELGDVFWYMAVLCNAIGCDFEELMRMNNAKLKLRFPDKFTEAAANERDLNSERELLERDFSGIDVEGMVQPFGGFNFHYDTVPPGTPTAGFDLASSEDITSKAIWIGNYKPGTPNNFTVNTDLNLISKFERGEFTLAEDIEDQLCPANGSQGCNYGPNGINGESQCGYCGRLEPSRITVFDPSYGEDVTAIVEWVGKPTESSNEGFSESYTVTEEDVGKYLKFAIKDGLLKKIEASETYSNDSDNDDLLLELQDDIDELKTTIADMKEAITKLNEDVLELWSKS